MKNINTSALALCVLTLVVVCGFVFSTGVTFTKFEYRSSLDGYRCVPNETPFEADDIDYVTCGRLCYVNNQCSNFFYQLDNHKCIGCRVELSRPLWINSPQELPGSMHFRKMKRNLTTNCKAILENDPSAASGPYEITVEDIVWKVYCDMTTDGGGWTVIQNRFNGSVDFYRNFSEYENGFGDINGECWLGLKYVQILANKYPCELKLVLTRADGVEGYEQYRKFKLLDGADYRLYVSGRSTNITAATQYRYHGFLDFERHSELAFTTFDRDKDKYPEGNCAVWLHGAWWFRACGFAHLNGKYCTSGTNCTRIPGLYHYAFAGEYESLKKTKMMIRPNYNRY